MEGYERARRAHDVAGVVQAAVERGQALVERGLERPDVERPVEDRGRSGEVAGLFAQLRQRQMSRVVAVVEIHQPSERVGGLLRRAARLVDLGQEPIRTLLAPEVRDARKRALEVRLGL